MSKNFVPRLYRRAPYRDSVGFKRFIYEFERERGNKIDADRAKEIFGILRSQSHKAEKER